MNSKIKEVWVNALRSGKYEQGSEKLRSVTGYCCLGVLCDIYAQEHNTQWEFRGDEEINPQSQDYWYFDEHSEFLPESVMNWAELKTHNPTVRVHCDDEDTSYYTDEIANVNDFGYDFSQIANIIEAQL